MRLSVLSICCVLLVAARARAQDADPARLFPRELDVSTAGGVTRFALPPEVLAAVRPDLSDLRLYDGTTEVPYLVDSGARPLPSWPALPRRPVLPVGATRRADWSGVVESFVLAAPPPAPPSTHWTLLLDTTVSDFVRSVHVQVTTIDGTPSGVVDTTVFRFESPLRERLDVPLPAMPDTARLSVDVVGEPTGFAPPPSLIPTFTYVAVAGAVGAPRISLPLVELARRRDAGHTYVTLSCPPGLRPDVLRIETTTTSFAREVRVRGDGRDVGGGTLYRVDLPSLRDGAVLELALGRFAGDRLEVTVDDGDSPPLASLRFVAEALQPALVFDSEAPRLLLRFGGGRVRPPRYDLATLAGDEGERLLGAPDLADGTAGVARANPRFDPSPALAFLGRPGVAVDATRMTWAANVDVAAAREGVAEVRVPAALVAVARADLGDLRIVAGDGRQFPYVLDSAGASVELPVTVGAPQREGAETRYALGLPVTRAVVASLRLVVDAQFTERSFVVRGRTDDDIETELVDGVLRRAPGDAGPLVVSLSQQRVHDLVLAVQDGDDAPLRIAQATAVARTPTLILAAPPGHYRLFAGDAQLAPPVYEMARARPLIDAVPLTAAAVGRPTRNPAFRAPGFFERAGSGAIALWAALLFAVLVLGVVTLRVARSEEVESSPVPPVAGGDPEPTVASPVPPPVEPKEEEGRRPSPSDRPPPGPA